MHEIGFLVIVGLRSNNFQTLTVAYSLARSIAINQDENFEYDPAVLDLIVGRLIRIISDISSTGKEALTIIKSAKKIIEESEKQKLLIESFKNYLTRYLSEKTLSKESLLEFYQGQGIAPEFDQFVKDLRKKGTN